MRRFKIISVVGILIFGLICCHKEDNKSYASQGKITGPDVRMCACCGGWYIEIDNLTYEFDSIPAGSGINLQKDSFPILVKLDWQLSDKIGCPLKKITIQRIRKE